MKKSFLKISSLFSFFVLLVSCDKDFNSLGSDVVGENNFDLELYDETSVIAYSKSTGPVQTNNLPINSLGVYSNSVFGKTAAHFVTQVELESPNPTLGTNIDIKSNDSVYLYIPYFSTSETTAGVTTYELDSIYGNPNSTLNLKIYESRYILRDLNPNPDPNDILSYNQRYFNDDKSLVEGNLGMQLNTGANTAENTQFKFDKSEIIIYKTDDDGNFLNSSGEIVTAVEDRVVKERKRPGMWINLDKDFFETQILNAGSGKLFNNTAFKEYFRGLYFQVEENGGQEGVMSTLDFSQGKITVQYHSDVTTTSNGVSTTTSAKRELVLNLRGNTVNFFDYSDDSAYQTAIADNSNATTGAERLFLKGGQGSVAFIDLFGPDNDSDGIPDQLEELRDNNWIINEANLVFHIDDTENGMQPVVGKPKEPSRIYLYDATNNRPIVDYTFDPTTFVNPKFNKFIFGGIIEFTGEGENKKGVSYKVRITEYINRIINSDDESINKNVRLGLTVTENIGISQNTALRTPIPLGSEQVKFVPVASAMNPLGTVLYGSNRTDSKKLKLQIFYSRPNN